MDKKPLKIVILNVFQGKTNRGAETFVKELAKRLGHTHQVTVLKGKQLARRRWPFLWRFYLDPHGIQVLLFTIKSLPQLISLKPDIVIPINGGWQPAIIRVLTWVMNSKMVISGQAGIGWDDRNNLWCFPNLFVATSKYQTKWAKEQMPKVSVTMIPNGVDLKKFNPKGEKSRLNLKRPVILAVGALVPEKRLDLTIRAVSLLPEASLLIVGVGSLKDNLSKLAQKVMRGRCFIISTTHERIPEVFRAADIFTLTPSSRESFGIVFLEAMATNLPVVTNNDSIRKEIIGAAGFFVDPTDTEKYSDALRRALNTNWGNKPRLQSEEYSWENIANKYEEALLKL